MNAEMLRSTELSPQQVVVCFFIDKAEYCDNMGSASELLLSIVNDILDLTKLEGGHVQLERIEFNPMELLEAIIAASASRVGDKALDLGLALTPSCPATLVGDPHRLHQVLINLLSNAIKFSVAGSVFVNVEAGLRISPFSKLGDLRRTGGLKKRLDADHSSSEQAVYENEVELVFSVRDTGIGMTQKQQSRLFQYLASIKCPGSLAKLTRATAENTVALGWVSFSFF